MLEQEAIEKAVEFARLLKQSEVTISISPTEFGKRLMNLADALLQLKEENEKLKVGLNDAAARGEKDARTISALEQRLLTAQSENEKLRALANIGTAAVGWYYGSEPDFDEFKAMIKEFARNESLNSRGEK